MKTAALFVLGSLMTASACADAGRHIRIRVQDYASVSPARRSKAFAVAGHILGGAGVSLIWLDCSPHRAGPVDPRCGGKPGSRDIILRLMPEKMASAMGLKTACLGYAILPRHGFGTMASVFVDKAWRVADRALASRSSVLGHAIAHEIAHLLIGTAEHSAHGLMQAAWSRSQLLRATASPMTFSLVEIQAIAESLSVRLGEPKPAHIPLQLASARSIGGREELDRGLVVGVTHFEHYRNRQSGSAAPVKVRFPKRSTGFQELRH